MKKIGNVANLMRKFFLDRGFVQVYNKNADINTSNYTSKMIPSNISQELWLEEFLLINKEIKGCFSVCNNFTIEGNEIKKNKVLKFESKGDINSLMKINKDILTHLGFPKLKKIPPYYKENNAYNRNYSGRNQDSGETVSQRWQNSLGCIPGSATCVIDEIKLLDYHVKNYSYISKQYGITLIDENNNTNNNVYKNILTKIKKDYGPVLFIQNYPLYTYPFWNIKYDEKNKIARKINIFLDGNDTITTSEKSCSHKEIKQLYNNINNNLSYPYSIDDLTENSKIINRELNDYLKNDFMPRYGGTIKIDLLTQAMDNNKLLIE